VWKDDDPFDICGERGCKEAKLLKLLFDGNKPCPWDTTLFDNCRVAGDPNCGMLRLVLLYEMGHGCKLCVCNLVLMTSSGVVNEAATEPAIDPANMDINRSYSFLLA
jgi:hypothetical protein